MTEWSGRLSGNVFWSGEISVVGDVVVSPGARLRVAAGTHVRFAPRPKWSCSVFRAAPEGYPIETSEREMCDIVVLGRLEASGSADAPVVFGDDDASWGGVIFLERAMSRLRHCVLGPQTEYALQTFDDASVDLEECSVDRAQVGVAARGLSRVHVSRGRVQTQRCGAVACEGSRMVLDQAQISGSAQGVCAEDWALLKASRSHFTATRDFAVLARGHSWARLDGCHFEKIGEKTIRQEHAKIDVC